jgi:hypothetical protein
VQRPRTKPEERKRPACRWWGGSWPENPLRLDVVGFQDVTQESRDFSGLVSREVLVAMDVLSTRGAGGAALAAIIATGFGHSDQVRESSGEFRERNGLG